MNTNDFLKALRRSNILPEQVMAKVEAKISNTDKHVTAKSVARYLIDKGFLSKYQARQLLAGDFTPADEMGIQVSPEESQDTDELLRDLNPDPKPEVKGKTGGKATGIEATRIATRESLAPTPARTDFDPLQNPQQGPAGAFPWSPGAGQAYLDPLGGFGGVTAEDEKEEDAKEADAVSFAGKKSIKNQWESKWVFIGFTTLGALLIAMVVLWFTLTKTDVSAAWDRVLADFNNGRWSAALTSLNQFKKDYPKDERIPDALVKIANCELRINYDTGNWENTLAMAKTVLPQLEQDLTKENQLERFEDIRAELSVMLPGTALGFTRKGLEVPDVPGKESFLALAEETSKLVEDPNYVTSTDKKNPGVAAVIREYGDNIAKIKRQIEMENDYARTLTLIAGKTQAGETVAAFGEYFRIVNTYPELGIRPDMRAAVAGISKREADLVKVVSATLAPAAAPESRVGSTMILGTSTLNAPVNEVGDLVLVRLIEGSLWGIRAMDGEIVWRKHLGPESRFQPAAMGEDIDADLIGSDVRNHHLFRFEAATGNEKWRIAVGEPFAEPFVSANKVLVTTLSGKVFSIDPDTGSTSQAAEVPQPTSISAVTLDDSPSIYQVSRHSNLYVINSETMQCREVFYIGHREGAIVIPPFSFSDHLIIAENGADYCRLHILRHAEEGGMLEKAQNTIQLEGAVSEPIVRYGRWALVVSDTGDMRMLEVNKGSDADPVSVVASLKYSVNRPTRKYITAKDGYLWNCGAGLKRYRVLKTQTTFKEEALANSSDTFIAPPVVVGNTYFNFRRRFESTLVSVSAFQSETLEEIWRTDFCAAPAGIFEGSGSRLFAVSAQGDVFMLGEQSLSQPGYFKPQFRGDKVIQRLVFDNLAVASGSDLVAVGPAGRPHVLNFSESRDPVVKLVEMVPPADKPAVRPVRFGDYLLVAASRGQVFRIDSSNGMVVGAPFQPEIEPNVPVDYREPAIIRDGESFIIGNSKGEFYFVEANGLTSLQGRASITHSSGLVSPLVSRGGRAIGICRGSSDELLSLEMRGDSLEITKSLSLPAGFVSGPVPAGDANFLVVLDNGKTVCFDPELNQVWEAEIPSSDRAGVRQAGAAVVAENGLMIAFETGLVVVVNPATGELVSSIDIRQPISGTPVRLGDAWYVPGADGTVHRLSSLSGKP